MSDKYYVLIVEDDIEPFLNGPYMTEASRDTQARKHKKEFSDRDAILWLDINQHGNPTVGSYPSVFFKDVDKEESIFPQHDTEAQEEIK